MENTDPFRKSKKSNNNKWKIESDLFRKSKHLELLFSKMIYSAINGFCIAKLSSLIEKKRKSKKKLPTTKIYHFMNPL